MVLIFPKGLNFVEYPWWVTSVMIDRVKLTCVVLCAGSAFFVQRSLRSMLTSSPRPPKPRKTSPSAPER